MLNRIHRSVKHSVSKVHVALCLACAQRAAPCGHTKFDMSSEQEGKRRTATSEHSRVALSHVVAHMEAPEAKACVFLPMTILRQGQ
jgi:hypothetical protein